MKLRKMRNSCLLGALVPLMGTAVALADSNTLVVTATNATNNQLLVYNTSGKLLQSIPTQGQGGAGGNSGGIQSRGNVVAVVNFGSQNVSLFERDEDGLSLTEIVPAVSKPLSVAFGPTTFTFWARPRWNRTRCSARSRIPILTEWWDCSMRTAPPHRSEFCPTNSSLPRRAT